MIAQTVSTSGNTSQASLGVPTSNVAKDDSKAADDATTTVAKNEDTESSDDDKKKKNKAITLAQKSGRVTVILPAKK